MATSTPIVQDRNHKRTKSSVLKSIITPRSHKRNASDGATLSSGHPDHQGFQIPASTLGFLPMDHPDSRPAPLGELFQSRERVAGLTKKEASRTDDRPATSSDKSLHKKTLSSISLASLAAKHKEKESKNKSKEGTDGPQDGEKKPKKSKSQTNFQNFLSRPKTSKSNPPETDNRNAKDKENRTPPATPGAAAAPPPIYAQFASQPLQTVTTSYVPLNDISAVESEMSLYTPQAYTPSKQRNFHGAGGYDQPTLSRRGGQAKDRPKSAYLPSSTSASSFVEAFTGIRKSSSGRIHPSVSSRDMSGLDKRAYAEQGRRLSAEDRVSKRKPSGESRPPVSNKPKEGLTIAKRGARVMAAVAAFNGRSKELPKEPSVNIKNIESAFEALLDSRNIPENMRQKLRLLDTNIKADFIKQDKAESASSATAPATSSGASVWTAPSSKGSTPALLPKSADGDRPTSGAVTDTSAPSSPAKRARPRSKTFTISKGDAAPKKQKSGSGTLGRAKQAFSTSNATTSLHSTSGSQGTSNGQGEKPRAAVPEEFVAYLRKVQQPQKVEVGRLHKLRLVLRNERVAWVDSFITMGGMHEIIELLNRIMQVEWREEHEDNLLHEVLLCLKALCTTALALQKLSEIQSSLFPALLNMIFDKEKKGPSEFTTRGIIVDLIFTYLEECPSKERLPRTRNILSYLRDPSPPEEEKPLGFIVEMHQPRPYRVWCKEIVDVTKEVFWIFLHGLNVVPIISAAEKSSGNESYAQLHFPKERPPVPAAPYVGGVEWEATNYIANHLDLMNGLIASLPTRQERNTLRDELKVSGFEKMMGISLRTCKEKFYGAVHDGLKTWVSAAVDDGWDVRDVRMGPPAQEKKVERKASPKKKKAPEEAPKVELPKLNLLGVRAKDEDAWVY